MTSQTDTSAAALATTEQVAPGATGDNSAAVFEGLRALGKREGEGKASKFETAIYLFENAEFFAVAKGEKENAGALKAYEVFADGFKQSGAVQYEDENGMETEEKKIRSAVSKLGVFIKLGATHRDARRPLFAQTIKAFRAIPKGERPSLYEAFLKIARAQIALGAITVPESELVAQLNSMRREAPKSTAEKKAAKVSKAAATPKTAEDVILKACNTEADYLHTLTSTIGVYSRECTDGASGAEWGALKAAVDAFVTSRRTALEGALRAAQAKRAEEGAELAQKATEAAAALMAEAEAPEAPEAPATEAPEAPATEADAAIAAILANAVAEAPKPNGKPGRVNRTGRNAS